MEPYQSKRTRRSSEEIKKLLETFSQSGMAAKDFCILHNISEVLFSKWRSRYLNKQAGKENNFVLLHNTSGIENASLLFAEVKGIRIYQPVAPCYLKELIA